MHTSRFKPHKRMRVAYALVLKMSAAIRPAAADDIPERLKKSVAALHRFTDSPGHGMQAEVIADADCIAIFPGFYKGAAVAGVVFGTDLLWEVSFGSGFLSCRNDDNWSAPGAVTMEGGSLGVQIGEKIDIVILSLDKQRRPELLYDRFTIG